MDEAYMAGLLSASSNDQRKKRPLSPCRRSSEGGGPQRVFKRPRLQVNCRVGTPRPLPQPMMYPSPSPYALDEPSASFTHYQYTQPLYEPVWNVYPTGLANGTTNWANTNTVNPSFIEACKSSTLSSHSMTSLFSDQEYPSTLLSYTESSIKSSTEVQFQYALPTGVNSDCEKSSMIFALGTALAAERREADRLVAELRRQLAKKLRAHL